MKSHRHLATGQPEGIAESPIAQTAGHSLQCMMSNAYGAQSVEVSTIFRIASGARRERVHRCEDAFDCWCGDWLFVSSKCLIRLLQSGLGDCFVQQVLVSQTELTCRTLTCETETWVSLSAVAQCSDCGGVSWRKTAPSCSVDSAVFSQPATGSANWRLKRLDSFRTSNCVHSQGNYVVSCLCCVFKWSLVLRSAASGSNWLLLLPTLQSSTLLLLLLCMQLSVYYLMYITTCSTFFCVL